ncbi:hypothetical protein D3C76_1233090 [compost metagenome]
MSNIYTNELVNTWRQLITVFTGKYFHVYYDTVSTMWYTQGSITYFTCFLTKDRMQETFFCCQLCYTLRCYFTNQNVASTNLSTDADNTALIQVTQRFFPNVRDVTCDLFRSELGITCF